MAALFPTYGGHQRRIHFISAHIWGLPAGLEQVQVHSKTQRKTTSLPAALPSTPLPFSMSSSAHLHITKSADYCNVGSRTIRILFRGKF